MTLLISFLCLAVALGMSSAQTVTLKAGTITGGTCPAGDVNYFFGIPYAQPPVNDLRFAPAQPYNGTYPGGTLSAVTQPNVCHQFLPVFIPPGTQSEDCLFVNVYAPNKGTINTSFPVKVWIHGGAWQAGGITDPLYGACNLANDAVVVEIAYRLGPLGFLYAPDAGIGGNAGITDLLTALEWVQENIVAFGGNPQKVMVFGQSAGAMATWYLSTLPQATTLMSSAIAESGAGEILPTNASVAKLVASYAANLNCTPNNASCFRAASPEALLSAVPAADTLGFLSTGTRFTPVIDGKIIPVDPNSVGAQVPLVAGTTSEEGTLFTVLAQANPTAWTPGNYSDYLNTTFGSYAPQIAARYPISLYSSTPFPAFYAVAAVYTDVVFKCPAQLALVATAKSGKPAYTYFWSHVPTCLWEGEFNSGISPALVLEILNATHTSEIPFVFNQTTNMPRPNGTCSFTAQEDVIAGFMANSWTSFAESQELPQAWPAWTEANSQGLLVGENGTSYGAVDYSSCVFWDGVVQGILNGSSTGGGSGTNGTATASSSSASASVTHTADGRRSVEHVSGIAVLLTLGAMLLLS